MAVVVESTSTFPWDGTNQASISITKPTGLSVGDVMVAVLGIQSTGSQTIDTATDWTAITNVTKNNKELKMQYKVADSDDVNASSFTFTNSGGDADGWIGMMYRLSGVAPTQLFDTQGSGTQNTATAISITVSVTPEHPEAFIITAFFGGEDGNGPVSASSYTSSPSITFTEDFDNSANEGSFDPAMATAHGTLATSSEITTFGLTWSAAKETAGIIAVFSSQRDETGTLTHLTTSPTLNSPTGKSGTTGTLTTLSVDPTLNSPSGEALDKIWDTIDKS